MGRAGARQCCGLASALSRAVPMPLSIEFEWTRVEYTQRLAPGNHVARAPGARSATSGDGSGRGGLRRGGHEIQQTQGTAAFLRTVRDATAAGVIRKPRM